MLFSRALCLLEPIQAAPGKLAPQPIVVAAEEEANVVSEELLQESVGLWLTRKGSHQCWEPGTELLRGGLKFNIPALCPKASRVPGVWYPIKGEVEKGRCFTQVQKTGNEVCCP